MKVNGEVVTELSRLSGLLLEEEERTNLIVNYLPQSMSQDDIRSLFSSMGEMENCKLIRDKATGQSLGYGFVNYKQVEHAQKAIESLNGLRLQNKTIKVSYARPSSESIRDANLYVCGLPKSLSQRELEALFAPCGSIISARIIYDCHTGLSKGVGFVRFDRRQEAERAIKQLHGLTPPGSPDPLTVKFANAPSSVKGRDVTPLCAAAGLAPCRGLWGPYTGGGALGRIRYPDCPLPMPGLLSSSALSNTSWCLFVYNLAPETEENVLWQLFGPFGAVQNVKVMRDLATHKCKGYGFVTMTNYEEALMAVAAIHGYQLGNRVLQVSFKKMKNHLQGESIQSSGGLAGLYGSGS